MEENKENQEELLDNTVEENLIHSEVMEKEVDKNKKKHTLNIVKKVLDGILLGIFTVLIVLVGSIAIQKYIMKKPVATLFGYSSYVVVTESMQGTIDAGDLIIVKDTDDYQIGDIITFFEEGRINTTPITHRIVGYSGDEFITKGDANNSKDSFTVSQNDIIGEVVKVVPNVGIFVDWLKNGAGFVYIILFFIIIGVMGYIIKKV